MVRSSRMLRTVVVLAAAGGIGVGCMPAPDFGPVRAELARPIRRVDLFQSAASNGKAIVAGTAAGVVVRSDLTGANWTRHALAQPASIVAMTHCPDGSFAALDFYKKVWIADAAATRWTGQPIPSQSNLVALTCDRANRLWVVGSHTTILSTSDGGASWTTQTLGEDAILTTVQFVDERNGVITGEFGLFLVTEDGGVNWRKRSPIPNEFYPYAALFTDSQTGWISGLAGVILHTGDGGRTWAPQVNGSGAPIYAMLQVGGQQYGVGAGGRVVTQREGRWTAVAYPNAPAAYWAAGAPVGEHSMLLVGPGGAASVLDVPSHPVSARNDSASSR